MYEEIPHLHVSIICTSNTARKHKGGLVWIHIPTIYIYIVGYLHILIDFLFQLFFFGSCFCYGYEDTQGINTEEERGGKTKIQARKSRKNWRKKNLIPKSRLHIIRLFVLITTSFLPIRFFFSFHVCVDFLYYSVVVHNS